MSQHFRLTDSETVDVTRDLAVKFSTMPAALVERDLKAKRLDYLKENVLNGRAITFCWAQAQIDGSDELIRVNGFHSSTMLAKLNGEFPVGLKAHIDTYAVADKAATVLLFRQIDNRLSARTVDDIAGAYQGLEEDLVTVPKAAGRKAVEGAAWFLMNKRGDDIPTGDERFDLFSRAALHPFFLMAGRVLSLKTPEFTKPVVGAMFGAWEREPNDAETFFGDVAKQGGGNDADHPATVLDAWLVEAREEKENKPKEHEVFYACAVAWNAFRNHKSLGKIAKFNKKKGSPELD
jgi:hypothetical protein